jgi:putative nucleotidyltransferase with HDIG domain
MFKVQGLIHDSNGAKSMESQLYSNLIAQVEQFAKPYYAQDKEDPLIWITHIQLVRIFALWLAEKEGADRLVVETAALLHDIGKYKGRKDHHIHGYNLAKTFLSDQNIPQEQQKLILKCILKHRTRFYPEDNEPEVKIIQSADILGTLFNENWQEHCRQTLPQDQIQQFYDQANNLINLDSAKPLAQRRAQILSTILANHTK